jgi:thioredoxin 2
MGDVRTDETGVIVACGSCGQQNRLKYGQLDHAQRCANCHTALPAVGAPIEIPSTAIFDALVSASPLPVLVDYWAVWCPPCRVLAPELVKVAESEAGRLIVAKVNTDDLADLGDRANIRSIPTMAVFVGGREVGRTMGSQSASRVIAFVNETVTRATGTPATT